MDDFNDILGNTGESLFSGLIGSQEIENRSRSSSQSTDFAQRLSRLSLNQPQQNQEYSSTNTHGIYSSYVSVLVYRW